MECPRIPDPVPPYAPMEVKGLDRGRFSVIAYILFYSFQFLNQGDLIFPAPISAWTPSTNLEEMSPDTRSGGSMHSNGSKGVRELFFFYSEMWVFFFYGMRDALGPNPIPLDFSGDSPPTG